MKKEVICTVCPIGCRISVEGEGEEIYSVTGFTCKRGETYARNEFAHPVRILTSTVKTDNESNPLLPVRSSAPVPKGRMMDCMNEIRKVCVSAPVNRYDVVIADVCGLGIDIVATGSLEP